MSLVRTSRRQPAAPQTPAVQEAEAEQDTGWVGGWSTGAQANSAALLSWLVWGLIALGPLPGALASPSAPERSP